MVKSRPPFLDFIYLRVLETHGEGNKHARHIQAQRSAFTYRGIIIWEPRDGSLLGKNLCLEGDKAARIPICFMRLVSLDLGRCNPHSPHGIAYVVTWDPRAGLSFFTYVFVVCVQRMCMERCGWWRLPPTCMQSQVSSIHRLTEVLKAKLLTGPSLALFLIH